MMIHSFVLADLTAQRTHDLRAEADAERLARVAARARTDTATEGDAHPRRRSRPWRAPDTRPV
jgi:hypothetical protein